MRKTQQTPLSRDSNICFAFILPYLNKKGNSKLCFSVKKGKCAIDFALKFGCIYYGLEYNCLLAYNLSQLKKKQLLFLLRQNLTNFSEISITKKITIRKKTDGFVYVAWRHELRAV